MQFVDEAGTIREEFVEFILCESGTTGEALAGTITGTLEKFALDLSYLRGGKAMMGLVTWQANTTELLLLFRIVILKLLMSTVLPIH